MSPPAIRDYYPIWAKLKSTGRCSITANKRLHPRIIKAVTKEKWMDVGYKLELGEAQAFLSSSSNHSVLTFTLVVEKKAVPDMRKFNNSTLKLKAFLSKL